MNKTLIVIDMQNDFINGTLGTKEALEIVPNVKKKIDKYRKNKDEIIFTRDTHFENYSETLEGQKLPVKHCIKDTNGWQISNELDTTDCEIIDKYTFGYTKWHDKNFSDVEIVGLCTDICVVSNALIIRAEFPNAIIKVDSECCAGVTPESHKAALETMKMCQIDII